MYEYDVELEQALYEVLARQAAPEDLIVRVESRLLHARPRVDAPQFSALQFGKRSLLTNVWSLGAHTVALAVIALLVASGRQVVTPKTVDLGKVDVKPFVPLTAPVEQAMGGGGGGGIHGPVEASKGRLPAIVKRQVVPPQLLKVDHPKLAAPAAIVMPQQIKLPDANMPNVGVPNSPQVALASQGGGSSSGFGQGSGGGIGTGVGNGLGSGEGSGYGGGIMHVGGGVSPPVLFYSVEPEFTDAARRAKYQGICMVSLIVDTQGNPRNIKVIQPLGMGLDQKAMEAVRQYKFRPAYYHGHPVPVLIHIEVNFRIY
jgi:periplasmic protein TonB